MGVRIRARLAREEGQTFIEMLTVMAMLSFVMAAVATLFVAGIHAQTDMDQRFQAQQNARLALVSIRHDIRTSCVAPQVYSTPSSGTPSRRASTAPKVVFASACSAGVADQQRHVVRRLLDRRRAVRALPADRDDVHLQHRRQEGRPAEGEHGLRALYHERPASSARVSFPVDAESLDFQRRLHPE